MQPETEATEVVIFTRDYRISGFVSLVPGARLTDFLREAPTFIAIADATVQSVDGTQSFSTSFMDVRRDAVDVALPLECLSLGEGANAHWLDGIMTGR